MAFYDSWVPSWLKAIYEIVSRIGKFLWLMLTSLWHIITVAIAMLVAFFDQAFAALSWLGTQLAAAWGVLSDSTGAMQTAVDAGWPPQMATAVWWVNQYAPLTEMCGMIASLSVLWIVMTILRMVKSFIPTVSS